MTFNFLCISGHWRTIFWPVPSLLPYGKTSPSVQKLDLKCETCLIIYDHAALIACYCIKIMKIILVFAYVLKWISYVSPILQNITSADILLFCTIKIQWSEEQFILKHCRRSNSSKQCHPKVCWSPIYYYFPSSLCQ